MLPRHISELWLPSVKFGRQIYMFLCTRCTFQVETVEPRPSPSMDKQTASIYIYTNVFDKGDRNSVQEVLVSASEFQEGGVTGI